MKMRTRMKLTLLTAATITLAVTLVSVARDTPAASSTPHAGNWFGPGKKAPPSLDVMGEAALFAQMYPELARMDKTVRDATPRILFDSLGARGKPPLKMSLLWSVGPVMTDASDRKWVAGGKKDPWVQVFDERRARIGAVDARQRNASLYIDVETLPLDTRTASPAEVDRSVRMIAQEVGWIRAQDPNIRLFMYDGFPVADDHLGVNRMRSATTKPGTPMFQWWRDSAVGFEKQREARRAANERLMRSPTRAEGEPTTALAELFDATCPSLYLFNGEDYPAAADIQGFVRESLNESRRYGKPVYPFVWYLQAKDNKPVPLKQWTLLMRETLTYADGAILWDLATQWNSRLALRVRLATLIADRKGEISDAELFEAVKADYPNDAEVNVLRGDAPATQQTP